MNLNVKEIKYLHWFILLLIPNDLGPLFGGSLPWLKVKVKVLVISENKLDLYISQSLHRHVTLYLVG